MEDADLGEKYVKRKLLVAQLLQRLFSADPGTKVVGFLGSDLKDFDPLLHDPSTFLTSLRHVQDELAPDFQIEKSVGYRDGFVMDWVTIGMKEPKRLGRYITEKEIELAEISEETRRHAFTLDRDANLYLANSELPPYSIERGSLRHKIVYYLAKHGGYMSAAQLAEKIDSNPKRIRTTVGQLRKKVNDYFGVPGADLIHSKDTGSYSAGKITLRVPKGYTP